MLNKKILAVAIASAFSMNAMAAQDLTVADLEPVVFASELITTTGSDIVVTNAGSILDVTFPLGFSISDGTSKYIRLDLNNAVFETAVTGGALGNFSIANGTFALSQGGAKGDDFVIVELTATAGNNLSQTDEVTVALDDLNISRSAVSSVTYNLYDSAPEAVSETGSLADESGVLASVESASTGVFTVADSLTATIASGFKEFATGPSNVLGTNEGFVGAVDVTEILEGTVYNTNGSPAEPADFFSSDQTLTISGDFSVGAWELDPVVVADGDSACDGNGAVALTGGLLNEDENLATLPNVDVASNNVWHLCVTVSGNTNNATDDVLNKASFSATLVDDELTGDLGRIIYDTTSFDIPYLTTFSGYNQRIYITNKSSAPFSYSMTFTSEDVADAEGTELASGTVPAGELVVLRADQVVEITGDRSRTAAQLEVEAQSTDVSVAIQNVRGSDGTTDTVIISGTQAQ